MKLNFLLKSISIIIVVALAFFSSCKNEDCTTVMTFEYFFLEDKDGNDLLNTADYDFIDNLQVLYPIGDKLEKGNYGINPYGEGRYCLTINLNGEVTHDNISYTYVKWNEHDTDTIIANVDTKTKEGCIRDVRTMVAYNDSVWKRPDSSSAADYNIFKIVK